MPKVLRCYAEGRNDEWEAICLDLDIAVQGNSFVDVFRSLDEAIALYLESVGEVPASERAHLLDRPAPLSVRFQFFWHVLGSLFHDKGEGRQRHHFTMPRAA